ncbi:MAG: zinc ribbon domain-containing protein [Romboutsia sp.]
MGFFDSSEKCGYCGGKMGITYSDYKDGYACSKCTKKAHKIIKGNTKKFTINELTEIINKLGDDWDKCDACGSKLGWLEYDCVDATICDKCASLVRKNIDKEIKKTTLSELQPYVNKELEYQDELDTFTPTKVIETYLEVDENKGEWLVPDGFFGGKKHPRIFKFEDIINYELLVDESSIASGGLGRAIAGGVLFGGAGAIVGGVTGKKRAKGVIESMKIKITVNDLQYPTVYIKLITATTKVDSWTYRKVEKQAQECLSVLDLLVNKFAREQNQESSTKEPIIANDFMFCKECGAKITRDSKFCSSCGEKI